MVKVIAPTRTRRLDRLLGAYHPGADVGHEEENQKITSTSGIERIRLT